MTHPPTPASDSLLCYEDIGPDLIHLIPGDLLAVSDQGPLQIQDAGGVVEAGVVHLLPDAVVQVLHQQLLGRLQQAWTLCLGSDAPRLEFWKAQAAFSSQSQEHHEPPCFSGEPTLGQPAASTLGMSQSAREDLTKARAGGPALAWALVVRTGSREVHRCKVKGHWFP